MAVHVILNMAPSTFHTIQVRNANVVFLRKLNMFQNLIKPKYTINVLTEHP